MKDICKAVIDLIIRIKNSGYRLSETKREVQMRARKSNTIPIYLCCLHCPQIALKCHFQPIGQPLKKETTKESTR